MNEEVKLYLDDTKEQMQNSISHLEEELARIRAGRANPKILNGITVDYYGNPILLSQVANISVPDPRTIAIQPWEKNQYNNSTHITIGLSFLESFYKLQ